MRKYIVWIAKTMLYLFFHLLFVEGSDVFTSLGMFFLKSILTRSTDGPENMHCEIKLCSIQDLSTNLHTFAFNCGF